MESVPFLMDSIKDKNTTNILYLMGKMDPDNLLQGLGIPTKKELSDTLIGKEIILVNSF